MNTPPNSLPCPIRCANYINRYNELCHFVKQTVSAKIAFDKAMQSTMYAAESVKEAARQIGLLPISAATPIQNQESRAPTLVPPVLPVGVPAANAVTPNQNQESRAPTPVPPVLPVGVPAANAVTVTPNQNQGSRAPTPVPPVVLSSRPASDSSGKKIGKRLRVAPNGLPSVCRRATVGKLCRLIGGTSKGATYNLRNRLTKPEFYCLRDAMNGLGIHLEDTVVMPKDLESTRPIDAVNNVVEANAHRVMQTMNGDRAESVKNIWIQWCNNTITARLNKPKTS